MKHALVTGCAGFIGSHLSERLIADGWSVIGVDAFTDYYERSAKEDNVAGLADEAGFSLVEADLATADLAPILRDAPVVFHLAAQPGVRGSFGDGFARYVHDNILATQRVFEAAKAAGSRRVVWASSSSVYGDAEAYPTIAGVTPTSPRSPYGATKRACEDLADIYRLGGLSTVGLRYFTVYGPRQRPDMAMRRICERLMDGGTFPMFGDGSQSRDFTHVSDAVEGTYLAGVAAEPDAIYNIGGGQEATLSEVIQTLEELAGTTLELDRQGVQTGDVKRTSADTTRARATLGWNPTVGLRAGLASEFAWVKGRRVTV
jgi:UDP-glucuronate 4-epimerase